jgi:hypothetical protein
MLNNPKTKNNKIERAKSYLKTEYIIYKEKNGLCVHEIEEFIINI